MSPTIMPPRIPYEERHNAYMLAARGSATFHQMYLAMCDLSRRLGEALCDPHHEYPPEIEE